MTKQELIAAINTKVSSRYDAGVSKIVIEAVLDTQAEVAQAELRKGGEVTLPGLGKLSVKERAAREGRNPATGEAIKIAAKAVPHFSATRVLKDVVA